MSAFSNKDEYRPRNMRDLRARKKVEAMERNARTTDERRSKKMKTTCAGMVPIKKTRRGGRRNKKKGGAQS